MFRRCWLNLIHMNVRPVAHDQTELNASSLCPTKLYIIEENKDVHGIRLCWLMKFKWHEICQSCDSASTWFHAQFKSQVDGIRAKSYGKLSVGWNNIFQVDQVDEVQFYYIHVYWLHLRRRQRWRRWGIDRLLNSVVAWCATLHNHLK